MMKLPSMCAAIAVACCAAAPLHADIVFLDSVKDNTLFEYATATLSNGAGEYLFAGTTNVGEKRRGLVAFDLSSIPTGATIQSVTLGLWNSRTITVTPPTVAIHRLTADWGEGTSDAPLQEGGGTAATTGDATWFNRFYLDPNPNIPWTTAGGDYLAAASATASVNVSFDWVNWGSTPQMVADVQHWLDNPAQNFGWIVIGDESTNPTAIRFNTHENFSFGNAPLLTVQYTLDEIPGELPEPSSLTLLALTAAALLKRR